MLLLFLLFLLPSPFLSVCHVPPPQTPLPTFLTATPMIAAHADTTTQHKGTSTSGRALLHQSDIIAMLRRPSGTWTEAQHVLGSPFPILGRIPQGGGYLNRGGVSVFQYQHQHQHQQEELVDDVISGLAPSSQYPVCVSYSKFTVGYLGNPPTGAPTPGTFSTPSTTPSSSPSSSSPPSATPSTRSTTLPTQLPTISHNAGKATINNYTSLCPSYNISTPVVGYKLAAHGSCGVSLCPGDTVTIDGCPADDGNAISGIKCVGNTFFNLYSATGATLINGTKPSSTANDYAQCPTSPLCPRSSYTLVSANKSACTTLEVRGGCVGGACSGRFSVKVKPASPTSVPTVPPSNTPTCAPSSKPSSTPTKVPSRAPSPSPTYGPSLSPTVKHVGYNYTNICPMYTSFATSNTNYTYIPPLSTCGVYVCPGSVVIVNGCPTYKGGAAQGVVCQNDPFFSIFTTSGTILVDGVNEQNSADDDLTCVYSSKCPRYTYTYPSSSPQCTTLLVEGGCYGGGCTARFGVSVTLPQPSPSPTLRPTRFPTVFTRKPTRPPSEFPTPGAGLPTLAPTAGVAVSLSGLVVSVTKAFTMSSSPPFLQLPVKYSV